MALHFAKKRNPARVFLHTSRIGAILLLPTCFLPTTSYAWMLTAVHNAEVAKFQNDARALNEQITSLNEQIASLSKDVQNKATEVQDKEKQISELHAKISQLESEISQLSTTIDQVKAANNQKEASTKDANEKSESKIRDLESSLATLEEKLTHAKEEAQRLRVSNEEMEKALSNANNQLKTAQENIAALQKENAELKAKFADEMEKLNSANAALQAEIAAKNRQNLELQTNVEKATSSMKSSEQLLKSETNAKIEQLEKENSELKDKILAAVQQINEKNEEFKKLALAQAQQDSSRNLAESNNLIRIDFLKTDLRRLKNYLKNLIEEKRQKEIAKNNTEADLTQKLTAERQIFIQILNKNREMERRNLEQIDSLKTKLRELTANQQLLVERIKATEQQYEAKLQKLAQTIQQIKASYSATLAANRRAELANLFLIDSLKTKLGEKVSSPAEVMQYAQSLAQEVTTTSDTATIDQYDSESTTDLPEIEEEYSSESDEEAPQEFTAPETGSEQGATLEELDDRGWLIFSIYDYIKKPTAQLPDSNPPQYTRSYYASPKEQPEPIRASAPPQHILPNFPRRKQSGPFPQNQTKSQQRRGNHKAQTIQTQNGRVQRHGNATESRRRRENTQHNTDGDDRSRAPVNVIPPHKRQQIRQIPTSENVSTTGISPENTSPVNNNPRTGQIPRTVNNIPRPISPPANDQHNTDGDDGYRAPVNVIPPHKRQQIRQIPQRDNVSTTDIPQENTSPVNTNPRPGQIPRTINNIPRPISLPENDQHNTDGDDGYRAPVNVIPPHKRQQIRQIPQRDNVSTTDIPPENTSPINNRPANMPISGPPPVILPASLPQISGQPDAQKIPNLPINYAPTQIPQLVASDSHNIYTKSMAEIPRAETIETKEDNSINFAIESILNAILLMTNGDKTQANTAMNLIGAGKDLPKKVKAVLKVVEKQWESEFFEAVVNEIANRFNKKQLFVDKTLRYLFGENGNLLTQW